MEVTERMAALESLTGAKTATLEAAMEARISHLEGLLQEHQGQCSELLAQSDTVTGA